MAYMDEGDLDMILSKSTLQKLTPNTQVDADSIREKLGIVRRNGYAIDDEEYQLQGYCIGVPIFDASGKVCAAISCSITKTSENMEKVPALQKAMLEAGKEISHEIGYFG